MRMGLEGDAALVHAPSNNIARTRMGKICNSALWRCAALISLAWRRKLAVAMSGSPCWLQPLSAPSESLSS
jgi:hypothetical protein